MARKTVLVCDKCGREVGEGKGATLRLNYTDARRGVEAGRPLRQLRERDARPRSGEAGPPAEVRQPPPSKPRDSLRGAGPRLTHVPHSA